MRICQPATVHLCYICPNCKVENWVLTTGDGPDGFRCWGCGEECVPDATREYVEAVGGNIETEMLDIVEGHECPQ